MNLEPLIKAHWQQVKAIYLAGIATGNATFTTSAPSWDEWDKGHLVHSRLVALDEAREVLGWAALSPVSGRCIYGGVGEVSVYVATDARSKGIGRALLERLIAESEQHGMWTLQAGIFPENTASVKLHEAFGFRTVGYRERIGQLQGRWRDTLLLERRSSVVGTALPQNR